MIGVRRVKYVPRGGGPVTMAWRIPMTRNGEKGAWEINWQGRPVRSLISLVVTAACAALLDALGRTTDQWNEPVR